MHPEHLDSQPDPRIMGRLTWMIRRLGRPKAFASGGMGLARAIHGSRGIGPLPEWAEELADTMVGALLPAQAKSRGEEDGERLVHLATSAAVLSLVRPRISRACDDAIAIWMGGDLGRPETMRDTGILAARALLAMHLGDMEQAEACVQTLTARAAHGAAWALHDWIAAIRRGDGPEIETECFHNLRLALCGEYGDFRSNLYLLAALVLWTRLRVPRVRALYWLDEVAREARDLPERRARAAS